MFIVTRMNSAFNVKAEDVIWIVTEKDDVNNGMYTVLIGTEERDYGVATFNDCFEVKGLIRALAEAFAYNASFFSVEDWLTEYRASEAK